MTRTLRSANAEFQVLEALRTNRQKRNREGAFLVEGVRNIDAVFRNEWTVRTALIPTDAKQSSWAQGVLARCDDVVAVAPALFDSLTDREERPEVVLVVEKRVVALSALTVDAGFVGTVLDRPSSPGNIGSIMRSCDALGSHALLVTGHGADPFDPRAVRASTGSFFAVPVVEVAGPDALREWADANRVALVGTDEDGTARVEAAPAPPVAYLFGNETTGLSQGLQAICDLTVSIPMRGTASSLNIAAAHAIVLFSSKRG